MGEIPQYMMGLAAIIASLTGVFTASFNFRKLSKMERERAAEYGAHRALHPDEHDLALEIAHEQMQQPHHLQHDHLAPPSVDAPKGTS